MDSPGVARQPIARADKHEMQAVLSPRLYLIVPPDPAVCESIASYSEADFVASVLIRSAGTGPAPSLALRQSVKAMQQAGIAVLCENLGMAKALEADGIHVDLDGDEEARAIAEVARSAPTGYIIGAGGLLSRHAAMSAAEQEIDYVMFGEPQTDGHTPALEAVLERAQWWSEVFTLPCVVYATDTHDMSEIAKIGADFVALEFPAIISGHDIHNILNASYTALRPVTQ